MVHIVLSKHENYGDGAALVAGACEGLGVSVNRSDIDDFSVDITKPETQVFFLTNDDRVGELARSLIKRGDIVINGVFLSGERSKSATQHRAAAVGVPTPKIQLPSKLTPPLYLKSQHHAHGVHRIETSEDLDAHLIDGNLPEGWYAEDAVDGHNIALIKLYWVDGYCYGRDHEDALREDVRNAMDVIAKAFQFDVFSADFIISKDSFWCIDINPAPALFGSTAARSRFAKHIARIQKRP